MENQEISNNFSVSKLLLTILCTVIVSVFLGTTILFISFIPTWIEIDMVTSLEENSDALIEFGKDYQENVKTFKEDFDELKSSYGEDYPAEGIFLYKIINKSSIDDIMPVYTMSFLIGVALGTIIYIVVIQNIKGKQILIELIISFIVLFILMMLLNLGYEAIVNKAISKVATTHEKYSTYIYDLENNNILIPYIIFSSAIYLLNIVRQKIINNKSNKQLHNK